METAGSREENSGSGRLAAEPQRGEEEEGTEEEEVGRKGKAECFGIVEEEVKRLTLSFSTECLSILEPELGPEL